MSNLVDIVAYCIEYIEKAERNQELDKFDACEEIRRQLCIIMQKIISYPTTTNFALPLLQGQDMTPDNCAVVLEPTAAAKANS